MVSSLPTLPSPTFPSGNYPSPSTADLSSLDFLDFIGLDAPDGAASSQLPLAGSMDPSYPLPEAYEPVVDETFQAGPSGSSPNIATTDASGPFPPGRSKGATTEPTPSRRASTRGQGRGRSRKSRGRNSVSAVERRASDARLEDMDVDRPAGEAPRQRGKDTPYPATGAVVSDQALHEAQDLQGMPDFNMMYGMSGAEYGPDQARLLQQQLESIHMQSPLMFNPPQSNSSYVHMTQMYPNTAVDFGSQHLPQITNNRASDINADTSTAKWPAHGPHRGIYTPAPSGEMYPQAHMGMMSPMQLEMLSRGDFNPNIDLNLVPLLSPALTQQTSSSFTSPAFPINQAASGSASHQSASSQSSANRSPLEQLQEQQRQFQEQLNLLQQQQHRLQATAAAVAAGTTSPYNASSAPASAPPRPVDTSGAAGPHSANGTASPGFFSPLTSPALMASTRGGHFAHHQQYTPAVGPNDHRQPHPLSALSSPALNPVGHSGGAQQTLSPALAPQSNTEMTDSEYLNALVGLLENETQDIPQQHLQTLFQSPHLSQPDANGLGSPAQLFTNRESGPHRISLPPRSRPSPMMKTTHHRSQRSQGSANFSLPNSPVVPNYHHQMMPGMTHLPPAAIVQQSTKQHSLASGSTSTISTPSPVDLSHVMPPPPVPRVNGQPKGITPMTPASLMNLGSTQATALDRSVSMTPVPPPQQAKRQAVSKAALAVLPSKVAQRRITAQPSSAASAGPSRKPKLAPAAAGKRTPSAKSSLGVRPAAKAAAAGPALPLQEGEVRRTSHKAAEQKRRDSLKCGFDELRLLLPPINTEALDPETGEPIPGSSAPRLLPKSTLVPDDNPNRGVSKVALLRFSNEYIVKLHERFDKRDDYIDKLQREVSRLRGLEDSEEEEVRGDGGEDLLEMDMAEGEDDLELPDGDQDDDGEEEEEDEDDQDEEMEEIPRKKKAVSKSPALRATKTRVLSKKANGNATAGR